MNPHDVNGGEYWFRLPDKEAAMMSLPPAQLKCYLVVMRAIQRDRNAGKISARQVAQRAAITLRHVHDALTHLVEIGLLRSKGKPGAIATYSLPRPWIGADCTPTGEQLDRSEEADRIPAGKRSRENRIPGGKQSGPHEDANRFPPGEQNRFPTGKQHLEYPEKHTPAEDSGGLRAHEPVSVPVQRKSSAHHTGFPPGAGEPNGFEEFRAEYPAPKSGTYIESACRAYVGRISRVAGEHERLMAGLRRYKTSADWQRALSESDGRFIPSMEKFISEGRYLDHPPAAADRADEYSFEELPEEVFA